MDKARTARQGVYQPVLPRLNVFTGLRLKHLSTVFRALLTSLLFKSIEKHKNKPEPSDGGGQARRLAGRILSNQHAGIRRTACGCPQQFILQSRRCSTREFHRGKTTCRPLLLVLIAPVASAAEPGLSPNPVSPEAAQEEGILDTTRSHVRGFSLWLGESVNDWFGDRPFEDGGKVTNGRLGLRNL